MERAAWHSDDWHSQYIAEYAAIGRFFVEFSQIVWDMRSAVESRFAGPLAGEHEDTDRGQRMIELLLGEATAQPIADVFFAMCAVVVDDDEQKVGGLLKASVNRFINQRNDMAHGDWIIGFPDTPPWLSRVRPARTSGTHKHREFAVDALIEDCERLFALRALVIDYGRLALNLWMLIRDPTTDRYRQRLLGELRVSDVLVIRDGEVRREGPMAHLIDPY